MQDEFYAWAFRKKIFQSIEELQTEVDKWIDYYNNERPHSGKYCLVRISVQTWKESLLLTDEADADSGGDRPVRNNLSDWNESGDLNSSHLSEFIPGENAFKNALP
jgi:hypothetical protein